jgi:hypothetical protein
MPVLSYMRVYAHAPACRFIRSPSAHPPGERARPCGSNWSAPLDERLGRAGPGLLGFAWADGDRMNRLPTPATGDISACPPSILEPEVPAGGIESRRHHQLGRSLIQTRFCRMTCLSD